MQIKTFTDRDFGKDDNRIEKLDTMVNEWLRKNDIEVINIQRNEDGSVSYITICYEKDE